MTDLDLSSNVSFGNKGAIALASALRVSGVNGVLKTVNLAQNSIRAEGAAAIADALRGNGVLKILWLSVNSIDDEGAKALASALLANAVVKILWLYGNNIHAEGAAAIAEALRVNRVLKTLNLSQNQLCGVDFMGRGTYSVVGITALAEALKVNGVLTKLVLFQNNIGDEGAKALASALRVNGVLTTLDISDNRIGPEGGKAIAEALLGNGVLKSIDLSENNLGDEGEKAIRDAVSEREGFELNGYNSRFHVDMNDDGSSSTSVSAAELVRQYFDSAITFSMIAIFGSRVWMYSKHLRRTATRGSMLVAEKCVFCRTLLRRFIFEKG